MKQLIVLFGLILTISVTACKKQETCATYSKATKVSKSEVEMAKI
jgi:uncharacterized lipoprotein YehR (DUF1307 family)